MYQIIVIRHGQSEWNKQNRFTGWVNVNLSDQGVSEALEAGKLIKNKNLPITKIYSSYLNRAIKTAWIIMEEADLMATPMTKHWRLNERHYGGLQGKNKKETADLHGEEQVKIWRRSYDTPPPESDEPMELPKHLYSDLEKAPKCESLKDTCERVIPYWENEIVPSIKAGEQLLIAAHGNSIRGLIKHIKNISDEEIVKLEIPTGKPIVFKLDENFKSIEDFYLE